MVCDINVFSNFMQSYQFSSDSIYWYGYVIFAYFKSVRKACILLYLIIRSECGRRKSGFNNTRINYEIRREHISVI